MYDVDKNGLKAAIAYKYLLHVYLGLKNMTIDQILKENEYEIGFIALAITVSYHFAKGCMEIVSVTCIASYMMSTADCVINIKSAEDIIICFKAPDFMKQSPLCGHITGLLFIIYYNNKYHSSYQA